MSALKGGVPRAFRRHKGPDAYAYRRYTLGLLKRLGPLPETAMPTLKEAGLTVVDLARLRRELEELRARQGHGVRRKEERRLRAETRKTRIQLLLFERRLEEVAQGNGHSVGPSLEQIKLRYAK